MNAPARRPIVNMLQEFSIPLIAGVTVAILWANVDAESLHHFVDAPLLGSLSLHFLTNDVLMALFFGLAAKEITESCLPGGALHSVRAVINPVFATLGGVAGPALVFFGWVAFTGDASIANGWGIPTATDIAMGWLVARLVFGPGHPAVQFLVLLAVLDDGIGLAIIAVFYPDPLHPVNVQMLGLVAGAMSVAFAMRRARVQSFWPYVLVPGVMSWFGFHEAHLHPALALVPIVPFMPGPSHDAGLFVDEDAMTHVVHRDPLNRFEHVFKLPVDFGLFAFGLANAGVAFSGLGNATIAVFVALLVGKTFGVLGMGLLARELGFPLPRGVDARSLAVVGMVAGIGLTVALFLAGAAYTDPSLQGAAKMGALFSIAAAPLAFAMAKVLGVRRADAGTSAAAGVADEDPSPSQARA